MLHRCFGSAQRGLDLHIGSVILLPLRVVQCWMDVLSHLQLNGLVERILAGLLDILPVLERGRIGRLRPGQIVGALLHQKLRIGLGRRQLIALGRQVALSLGQLRFGSLQIRTFRASTQLGEVRLGSRQLCLGGSPISRCHAARRLSQLRLRCPQLHLADRNLLGSRASTQLGICCLGLDEVGLGLSEVRLRAHPVELYQGLASTDSIAFSDEHRGDDTALWQTEQRVLQRHDFAFGHQSLVGCLW